MYFTLRGMQSTRHRASSPFMTSANNAYTPHLERNRRPPNSVNLQRGRRHRLCERPRGSGGGRRALGRQGATDYFSGWFVVSLYSRGSESPTSGPRNGSSSSLSSCPSASVRSRALRGQCTGVPDCRTFRQGPVPAVNTARVLQKRSLS